MKQGANILLALMQLNIGGAETHVVELAKELKRKGYNVFVASNGGVYVKEIEEAGIKHYSVPLRNKNPLNMIRSTKMLADIIKNEKIDIVHSHARIPSFILGKLHKKMKFPFVTSAHWVFTTKYGLKYITDWGEKVVAVSEDIKTYLMDNYSVPESDIIVTINGIDTDKFSPDTDTTDIKAELNIKDDENVIVYVSRLDESRSLVAKQYIQAIPDIAKQVDKLRLVVVGAGDDFENVKAQADEVNKKLGYECITLTGARTDINKLVALSDLFVGVSRAALEAMAAQKPVIIAGNEGYIGLFDESKLQVGFDTNFCCRGCVMPSTKILLDDTLEFFNRSDEEKERLGKYGREIIKQYYSVSKMADDCIKAYDWATSKKDEILISGYYGFHNSGDDALLKSIVDGLKEYKESPNITILSADPKETYKSYKVSAINRYNIFKIIKHMKKADMLISGGGTLMQDRTSTKSLLYYIAVIKMAKKYGLKVMLYSNGIGPLIHEKNQKMTKDILDKVDLITIRDQDSLETLKSIGVTNPKILLTADPAFTLKADNKEKGKNILNSAGVPNKKYIGISVRKWSSLKPDFENIIANVCDRVWENHGLYPVFIPMQPSKDAGISKDIMAKMKNKSSIIEKHPCIDDMIAVVGNMECIVGMRLHTLMYSAINNVPMIGLIYDPKISGFMKNIDQARMINIDELTEEKLYSMVQNTIINSEKIKEELNSKYSELKEKAQINAKLAIDLYEKGSVDI